MLAEKVSVVSVYADATSVEKNWSRADAMLTRQLNADETITSAPGLEALVVLLEKGKAVERACIAVVVVAVLITPRPLMIWAPIPTLLLLNDESRLEVTSWSI